MSGYFRSLFKRITPFRFLSGGPSSTGEKNLTKILQEKFPQAVRIEVTDISGGCGAMYQIDIESNDFQEKNRLQQHMMVNEALKNEIKDMHGLRINTSVPEA